MKKLFLASVVLFGTAVADDRCCEWDFCEAKWHIGADWLYWKIEEDGLFAGALVDDFPSNIQKVANVSEIKPGFKWNNGFRVWAGFEFPCDPWGMDVRFTHMVFHSHSDSGQVIDFGTPDTHFQFIVANSSGFPTFNSFTNNGLPQYDSLFTKWHGNFSYLDVDLIRTLAFGNCFKMYPHMGFRAAWIKQELVMGGNLHPPSISTVITSASFPFDQRFRGYGVEGGFWTDWYLGCGFSIWGHFGGSILYSRFKLTEVTKGFNDELALVYNVTTKATEHTAIPTVDYSLGLEYLATYCNIDFAIFAGWEQIVFFDMNNLSFNGGNFSGQGLTLGLDIGF